MLSNPNFYAAILLLGLLLLLTALSLRLLFTCYGALAVMAMALTEFVLAAVLSMARAVSHQPTPIPLLVPLVAGCVMLLFCIHQLPRDLELLADRRF